MEGYSDLGPKPWFIAGFIEAADMDRLYTYEIRVEGHLPDRWSEWFCGLTIYRDPKGETVLSGVVLDQAALFGVLTKIHDLNLILVSVFRIPNSETNDQNSGESTHR